MTKPRMRERFAALQVFQDGAPRLAVACLSAIEPYYSVNRYLYRYRRVVAAKRAYDQRRRRKAGRPLREEEWYADGSSPGSLTDELFRAKGVVAGDVVRRLVFEGCLVAIADTSPRQYQITEKGRQSLQRVEQLRQSQTTQILACLRDGASRGYSDLARFGFGSASSRVSYMLMKGWMTKEGTMREATFRITAAGLERLRHQEGDGASNVVSPPDL